MYFWRVDRLNSDLVAGRVGEPETFRYILACLAALALGYLAGVLDPPEIRDRWTLATDVAASLTVVPGTMLAYAANGGARGRHFPARYFSLAWVLTVRCVALTLPASWSSTGSPWRRPGPGSPSGRSPGSTPPWPAASRPCTTGVSATTSGRWPRARPARFPTPQARSR